MSGPIKIKTQAISQDTFPGAYIEPEWSRVSLIQQVPSYAMRLVLGAKVVEAPRGRSDYVEIVFEGIEYVLHISNFKFIREVAKQCIQSQLEASGKCIALSPEVAQKLRYEPDFIINGMEFCRDVAIQLYDVPLEKSRMLWVVPDITACGWYRSRKPHAYQQSNDSFFSESTEFANYNSMAWFDCFVIHRVPLDYVLAIAQNLSAAGKVIVYEFDDDLFNIPDWNHNQSRHTAEALERARVGMKLADIIICSTEQLVEVCNKPEAAMVGPNLIDMQDIGLALECSRQINQQVLGYKAKITESKTRSQPRIEFIHPTKPMLHEFPESAKNPIRILWTGSNTHDEDLQDIVDVVVSIGNKYGLAVVFVFFGYCPNQFLEAITLAGNTKPKFVVKPEYQHLIYYVDPVPFHKYLAALREIDPDIAICPLTEDQFNLSKSSLKILELGAFGIPVIATDYGPYSILKSYEDGILISLGDKTGWKDAIEKLIKDVDLRIKLGRNLRKRISLEYSWNNPSEQRDKWDAIFTRINDLVQSRRQEFYERISELQDSSKQDSSQPESVES